MDTLLVRAADRRQRRKHSAEFKASVIQACKQPGVSMAAVALANGLNANMLRKWVQESEGSPVPALAASPALQAPAQSFIALPMPAAPAAPDIRIEMQRAGTTINVSWPGSAAAECAAWLRELLR